MKKGNMLKNMELKSVDFVPRGANQESDIELFKSADGELEAELEPKVKKSFIDRVSKALSRLMFSEMDDVDPYEIGSLNYVAKNETVQEAERIVKMEDYLYCCTGALEKSFSSILGDNTLQEEERQSLLLKSLDEFSDTVKGDLLKPCVSNPKLHKETTNTKKEESEEVDEMKIDKSLLTPEESAAFDALIQKATPKKDPTCKEKPATGKPATDEEDITEMPPAAAPAGGEKEKEDKPMEKSAFPPEIQKALDRMEVLERTMEINKFEGIAKKYAPLGYDSAELAETMYNLKKSSDANYDAYVEILEKSLKAVEASGMFGEIGKSYTGSYSGKGGANAKIDSIAKGYMEKDPSIGKAEALAKAWEDNPEIALEYEKETGGMR